MKELRTGEEAVVVIERGAWSWAACLCLVCPIQPVYSVEEDIYTTYYSSMTGIRPDSGQVIVLIFYLADVPTLGS